MPRTGCSLIINVFLQIIQNGAGVGERSEEGVGRIGERTGKEKEGAEEGKEYRKNWGWPPSSLLLF